MRSMTWCALVATLAAGAAHAQEDEAEDKLDASEADLGSRPSGDSPWNEYDGTLFTLRGGAGLLYDFATYAQDPVSAEQVTLKARNLLRDFRFILKGRFKFAPRLSYSLGYMYDGGSGEWRFRQTGIMIDLPEIYGHFFVGRTKEGFSTNKIMVGYNGWTMERATANDAFIPILADGLKWTGTIPSKRLVYNLGYFLDVLSQTESFNRNDMQVVGRAVWLPFNGKEGASVLHLALEGRWGKSNDGFLQFRSKPESYPAQEYIVDTGKFAAQHHTMAGFETYFRPGPLVIGLEYFVNAVTAPDSGNPLFHGGEVVFAWLITRETRPYNAEGAFFENVRPTSKLFGGGPGAFELVLRASFIDLDSAVIQGGTFWRVTPQLNWYLSELVRIELVYGYGRLYREGRVGGTQFFQLRFQFQII